MRARNIFDDIPAELPDELTEFLLTRGSLRIERIVSRGQCSPAGSWFDQRVNEWVILLSGRARLMFEQGTESVDLVPGDFLDIPAHCRHRVEWTDPDQDTVWLVVLDS